MAARAKMNHQGRIVIPAECRAAAGLRSGDDLIVEAVGEGELRLRTRAQAIKQAQDIVAKHGDPNRHLADELIAERRAEASRE